MSRNDAIELTIYKCACKCEGSESCENEARYGVRYFPCADESESMTKVLLTKPVRLCHEHLRSYLLSDDNVYTEYYWIKVE